MTVCTGLLGKPCTCNATHGDDETSQPRFPFAPGVIEGPPQDTAGLFTSRVFWIGGAVSILLWTALVLVIYFRNH